MQRAIIGQMSDSLKGKACSNYMYESEAVLVFYIDPMTSAVKVPLLESRTYLTKIIFNPYLGALVLQFFIDIINK